MKAIQAVEKFGELNFKVIKNVAYGSLDGYPVVIMLNPNSTRMLLVNVTIQSKLEKEAIKTLRRALKQTGIKAGVVGRVVSWPMKVGRDAEARELMTPIRDVIRTMCSLQIKAPCACGVCGLGGADSYVMHNAGGQQLYDTVHIACMDKLQMDMESRVKDNPGNYLTGALGAVVGAICGAIPALLVLVLLNIVSLWLFALIPIGANFGYRKFNGKLDLGAPIISFFMSLIGLAFLLLGYDVVNNIQYLQIPFGDAFSLMFQNTFVKFSTQYWSYMGSNLFMIGIFFLLGLIFSFAWLRRTNKVELKDLKSLKETAQPIQSTELQDFGMGPQPEIETDTNGQSEG